MNFKDLEGRTLVKIEKLEDHTLIFTDTGGNRWEMTHEQDCCEHVYLEDVCGDLDDLLNTPLTLAEEESNYDGPEREDESYTWSFYKLATNKGYVTLRWLGTSSGYYSERVDLREIDRLPTKLDKALK
jgi:hypothetical protein